MSEVFDGGARAVEPGVDPAAIAPLLSGVRQQDHQAMHHSKGAVEFAGLKVDSLEIAQQARQYLPRRRRLQEVLKRQGLGRRLPRELRQPEVWRRAAIFVPVTLVLLFAALVVAP